jgi:hypothetical protein
MIKIATVWTPFGFPNRISALSEQVFAIIPHGLLIVLSCRDAVQVLRHSGKRLNTSRGGAKS